MPIGGLFAKVAGRNDQERRQRRDRVLNAARRTTGIVLTPNPLDIDIRDAATTFEIHLQRVDTVEAALEWITGRATRAMKYLKAMAIRGLEDHVV